MDHLRTNQEILQDVKTSVNVTRGEFEQLTYEVKNNKKLIDQILERKTTFDIPNKVQFILEISKMLNLSIGEVKEL